MIDVSSCNYINNTELGVNAYSLSNIIHTVASVLHVNPIVVKQCGALSCIRVDLSPKGVVLVLTCTVSEAVKAQ